MSDLNNSDEEMIKMLLTLLSVRIANDCGVINMDKDAQEGWITACHTALAVGAKRLGLTPMSLQ
jgi:hypothetical protein